VIPQALGGTDKVARVAVLRFSLDLTGIPRRVTADPYRPPDNPLS